MRAGTAGAAALLGALAACRSEAPRQQAAMESPDAWTAAPALVTAEAPAEDWWRAFQDPVLDGLVARALAQNLDLEIARARVLEARAVRDATAGGDDIHVDAVGGYSRARRSENEGQFPGPREDGLWSLGFDARWELDFFGRIDSETRAAEAGVAAAVEERHDTTVTLLGEVARAYVEVRGTQQELAVARANLELQRQTAALTRGRFQAGMASELDAARADALVHTTRAALPVLEAAIETRIHRLAVLLALEPSALAGELGSPAALPAAPGVIAAGLPADLLRRRADVRRAERLLARECALTEAARATLYPRVTLVGTWGQRSTEGADLFDAASNAWALGAGIVQPIFAGGILRANVRAQEARERQALVAWQASVLAAQAEVEDALTELLRERERGAALADALGSQRRAVELANDLFTRGLVDLFEVIDAQRVQFDIETDAARSATRASTGAVALYKALGGGWSAGDAVAPDGEP